MTKFKKYALIYLGLGVIAAPYFIIKDNQKYDAIRCAAAYSLARDAAMQNGDNDLLRQLTDAQNEIFLRFEPGELAGIDVMKSELPADAGINPEAYCDSL